MGPLLLVSSFTLLTFSTRFSYSAYGKIALAIQTDSLKVHSERDGRESKNYRVGQSTSVRLAYNCVFYSHCLAVVTSHHLSIFSNFVPGCSPRHVFSPLSQTCANLYASSVTPNRPMGKKEKNGKDRARSEYYTFRAKTNRLVFERG